MARFHYQVAQADGALQAGTLQADSLAAARQTLAERGLTILELKELGAGSAAQSWFSPAMNAADLCWATRELASLLSASLPLEAALTATIEQAERKTVAAALQHVCDQVRGGMRLADAMAERPRDFPAIYRSLVSAGENAGDLARVMERLADYLENRDQLRSTIISAFIYPAILVLVSTGIVVFLLSYVVPQVIGAFAQARQELPLLTRLMLQASRLLGDYGLIALLLAALGIVLARMALQNAGRRLRWHALLLRLPGPGGYVQGVNTARFASTLAILIDAGVPLLTALEAARQTLGNQYLAQCVQQATQHVREGSNLAPALKRQKVFPSNLIHLLASGEKTGALAPMLDRAAANLSRDLERRALRLTAMLEPMMTLGMGAMVMMIVLAILMPIMAINQMVQ